MSSFGTVSLRELWAMLDTCASEHTRTKTKHNWVVRWRGRTYHRLLLGEHGKRRDAEVQLGHVRNLVRHLRLPVDCANHHLPQLRMKSPDLVLDDVHVVADGPVLTCELGTRRIVLHRHCVRPGSQTVVRGDHGRLVIGEDTAATVDLR